jgi:hypothetical protein
MGLPCQFRAFPMFNAQFILTLFVLVAALAVIVRMIVLERRPRSDLKPRLIPTTPVLLVSGFIALLALIHLVNLAGIHTGRFR